MGTVELVLELYARLSRRENALDLFHEDIDWVMPHPGGELRGVAELARWWPDFMSTWDDHEVQLEKVWELDDGRVLVFFTESGVGRGSGVRIDARPASLWTLRDGKVARFQAWADRAEALREAGLDAPPPGGDPSERGAQA